VDHVTGLTHRPVILVGILGLRPRLAAVVKRGHCQRDPANGSTAAAHDGSSRGRCDFGCLSQAIGPAATCFSDDPGSLAIKPTTFIALRSGTLAQYWKAGPGDRPGPADDRSQLGRLETMLEPQLDAGRSVVTAVSREGP
jgi:hypothetical protein